MKRTLLLSAAMLLPSAAYAEQDHSAHQGHDMPAEQIKAEAPPAATGPHAGHDMGKMEEVPAEPADPHAGHDMSAMPADDSAEGEVGDAIAPAPPGDHAADAVFGAGIMAQSRKELAHEVGGMGYSLVMLDLAEVGFQNGRETYRFEGEAFTGGNINRFGVNLRAKARSVGVSMTLSCKRSTPARLRRTGICKQASATTSNPIRRALTLLQASRGSLPIGSR